MARHAKEAKTNALRELDAAGIPHEFRLFDCEGAPSGVEASTPTACSRRSSPWESPASTTCS